MPEESVWTEHKLGPITQREYPTELLVATARANAEYYTRMADSRWASDDDTDYINSHSELMLAVNALWYDGQIDPLIDWLSVWVPLEENPDVWAILKSRDAERLIEYIVGHIAR